MPINTLRGDAEDVPQVATHTVGGTPAAAQIYTISCNGKSIAYTAIMGDTNTTIAAALLALLQATTIPEFSDAQYVVSTNVITSSSANGTDVPYTFMSSATGTGTFVTAVTTTATGHEWWSEPTNWTLGRIPAGALTAPVQSNPAAVAAGSLTLGTAYYWVITAVNSDSGETVKSNQKTATPVAASTQSNTSGNNTGANALSNGTPYYYVVTAISGNGFESVASNENSYTPSAGNNTAVLTWSSVTGATGYNIYRSLTSMTYGATSFLKTVGAVTTITDDGGTALTAGTPPASALRSASLSWPSVPGAINYNVYRSTTTNTYTTPALVTNVAASTNPTYTDTGTAVGAGAPPSMSTAVGDDIYMIGTSTNIKYGLPSDYLTPNSLHVDTTFTGQAGLPDQNVNGYYEYRQTYLKMAPASCYFGENAGSTGGAGCPLFRIDKGSTASVAFIVYQTGSPPTQGQPSLWIKGANSADTYVLQQGFIGLAVAAADTAQFTTMKIGYQSSPATDVQLTMGSGCTCGAISQLGGVVYCSGNVTSLTMASGGQGSFYLDGTATMGTLIVDGGTYFPKTTGTHTTVSINDGGTLDHRQDIRAFIITTLTLSDGCTYLDPAGTINCTGTNPLIFNGNPKNMTLDFGTNRTLTFNS